MKLKIIRVIVLLLAWIVITSTWYSCETRTTNHKNCIISGDMRTIVDTIYLNDNGRHVDIMMPTQKNKFTGYGWGSEVFYLEVPTWSDLTYRKMFNATKTDNNVLMHVKFNVIKSNDWVAIPVTTEELGFLFLNIDDSFVKDSNAKYIFVSDGYESEDAFYKAHGEYSLNYTCNTWANEMLKNSDIYSRRHAIFSEEVINIHR